MFRLFIVTLLFAVVWSQAPTGKLFQLFKDDDNFTVSLHNFITEKTETITVPFSESLLTPRGSAYDTKRKRILMYAHTGRSPSEAWIYKFPVTEDGGITYGGRTKIPEFTKAYFFGFAYNEHKDHVYVQYSNTGTTTETYLVDPDSGNASVYIKYPFNVFSEEKGFFYHQTEKKIMFVGYSSDWYKSQFYVVGGPNDVKFLELKGESVYSKAALDGEKLVHIDRKNAFYYELDYNNLNKTKITQLPDQNPYLMFVLRDNYYSTFSSSERSRISGFNLKLQRYISSTNTFFRARRTNNSYLFYRNK